MSLETIFKPKKLNSIKAVDDHLEKTLSRNDCRNLYALIRGNIPCYYHQYEQFKDKKWSKTHIDKMNAAEKIYFYYKIADIEFDIAYVHWTFYKQIQNDLSSEYNKKTKLPRQDNKTYINRGSRYGGSNRIRYPSKKRKSAWKRFYKLFPKLDPNHKDPILEYLEEKKKKEELQQKINESVIKSKKKHYKRK